MGPNITIQITKSGIIKCVDTASEKNISRFHGEWNMGPSTSSVIILERHSKREEISFGEGSLLKQVLFAGQITDGTLLEFFNFLGENARSGVLVVINKQIKQSIFFRDGQIKYATSNIKENRLGEILYRFGIVGRDVLNTALKDKTKRLGEKLIEMNAITVLDLYKAITMQIEEICYATFLTTSGYFYFYELVNEDLIPSNINISTRNILFEGVRRMDEMTYFKKKIPSPDVILETENTTSVTGLTQMEIATLKMIDGKKSLKVLARTNRLGLFETTKIVFNLLQGGYVKVKSMTSYMNITTTSLEGTQKMIAAYNKVFAYIGGRSSSEKLQSDVTSFFKKFEGSLAVLFEGITFSEEFTIDAEQLLANTAKLENRGKVFSLLYKAFDEIFYFLLFSSGVTIEPKIETELNNVIEKITKTL